MSLEQTSTASTTRQGDAGYTPPTALLLINLGTPEAPTPSAVRHYLRELLGDARVLDLPWIPRQLLLNAAILPFRPKRSAAQYRAIWQAEGSPLMVHSRALERALQARLPHLTVKLAMRYGKPSLRAVIRDIEYAGAERVILAPLYPQHASASTGSALELAYAELGRLRRVPALSVLPEFFSEPRFLDAVAAVFRENIPSTSFDHVLFSYHGLPLHQVQATVSPHHRCEGVAGAACCAQLGLHNSSCYRAQCIATTEHLARRLGVMGRSSTSFQSRLGSARWLLPNTEQHLVELARSGVRRLVVACPSFVADCLETLEEIGHRARATFLAAGGESLRLVPCVNGHPTFVEAIAHWVERRLLQEQPNDA